MDNSKRPIPATSTHVHMPCQDITSAVGIGEYFTRSNTFIQLPVPTIGIHCSIISFKCIYYFFMLEFLFVS
jgi:hypothetical protein